MDIFWNKPTDLIRGDSYNLQVYRTTGTENDPYSLIDTVPASIGGLDITSYTDSTGQASFHYYVKYVDLNTGTVSARVLARIEMSVREQRLVEQLVQQVPEVIKSRFASDTSYFVIRRALNDGLNLVNFFPPQTNYSYDNLPTGHETIVELNASVIIGIQQYLGIAIRDIVFSGGTPTVQIDRGQKIQNHINQIMALLKEYTEKVKMFDYPQPLGLGSFALATPQQRIFGILYGSGSGGAF